MGLGNIFSEQLNGLTTDYKAEVIAAEMIENGTSADKILITPLGARNRPHRKDVESVLTEVSEYDNKEYVIIKTHKEGMYDKMPEGIFHTPISYAIQRTEEQVIEGIKRHRLEEKAARLFFLPFDTALSSAGVQVALYENELDKALHNDRLINIFSAHWSVIEHLNPLQSIIFIQFLPLIHRMRDNQKAIEEFLQLMFQVPVSLKLRTQMARHSAGQDAEPVSSAIGMGALGVDITTGSCFDCGEFLEAVITIGPITATKLNEFTGKGTQERVMLILCDYLLPADLDIVIEYEFEPSQRECRLYEPGNAVSNCEMGVSTYL